jgi:hypothetical protein
LGPDRSSASLITGASAEWVPLNIVYHYVLTRSPAPEAAKIAISQARKSGRLRFRASEVREHQAQPGAVLRGGEAPPKNQPERAWNQSIGLSDRFSRWDWERCYATTRNSITKSLVEYVGIIANRDDVLRLWPQMEGIFATKIKPSGVSDLVWAIVLTIDEIEGERSTGLAGLTREVLRKKVGDKLSREISLRTLQKALPIRRNRSRLI